jgi:NADP-dependent 3-hydroxy acid dehydrogenase YdfG
MWYKYLMRRTIPALIAAACLAISLVASAAPHVSLADARKVALAKVPGIVVHEKLKKKSKGHDVYYFKIKPANAKGDILKKVEIDGDNGQVLKIKDVKAKAKSED